MPLVRSNCTILTSLIIENPERHNPRSGSVVRVEVLFDFLLRLIGVGLPSKVKLFDRLNNTVLDFATVTFSRNV